MRIKKQSGFTLIEILVTLVIGFVLIVLVYQTFRTTARTSFSAEETINSMQKNSSFLFDLSRRFLTVNPKSKDNAFDSKTVTLEIVEGPSSKLITFSEEETSDGLENLICREQDEIFGTDFSYPCMEDLDDISFSFFDGTDWKDNWDSDDFPHGMGLNFTRNGEQYFFPVFFGVTNEKQS